MRRFLVASIVVAVALLPAVAGACPQCADKADGNIASTIVLGAFVFFPFAVVGVVAKLVKRAQSLSGPSSGPALGRDRRLSE